MPPQQNSHNSLLEKDDFRGHDLFHNSSTCTHWALMYILTIFNHCKRLKTRAKALQLLSSMHAIRLEHHRYIFALSSPTLDL